MTLAPTSPRLQRQPGAASYAISSAAELPAHDVTVAEEHRWVTFLLIPFILGSAFFAAAVLTGNGLWMAGTIVLGVMGLIFSFLYLSISSNSN